MSSKTKSSTSSEYVPAICTHRPSHLPIELGDEVLGGSVLFLRLSGRGAGPNLIESLSLEEGEVVTRFL